MPLLRFIVLVVYVVASVALHTYLRDHPPRFMGKHVQPLERLMWALLRMWGPLLLFLPGLLWIDMTPIAAGSIVSFSLFIPLNIFLGFLWIAGAFPSPTTDWAEALMARILYGLCLFILLMTSVSTIITLSIESTSLAEILKVILFLVFVTFPPALAIVLVVWTVPDIIPTNPGQPGRILHALQHFTGFFTTFPKPSWTVEDGEMKMRIKGNPFYGVGPGWLMTEPENLIVLKDGTKIKRVVGPGIAFTETAESPYQVIDLRNQIRITRIDARTRDGIEVNLPISSLFRIDPGYKTITLEGLANQEPWPYRNQRDIYQIVFYEEVDPTGKTPLEAHKVRPWDDIPLKVAINRVKQVIPEYNLEELYSIVPESGTIDPATGKIIPETGNLTRPTIGLKVRETVKAAVEPLGFQILCGSIGNKIIPANPDVVKQRVEAWKASWMSKVMDWETEAQIQNLKDLSRIRSDARVELLSQILQQTSMKLEDRDNASRYVAHHLLENLLHLARNSQVKELLPETALPTLTQLQELTKEE